MIHYESEVPSNLRRPIISYKPNLGSVLIPGDTILSRKKASNPIEYIGHASIREYQKDEFPHFPEVWDLNHCRVYLGTTNIIESGGASLVFEYTSPFSKVSPLEFWMLEPSYAIIYRNKRISAILENNPELANIILLNSFSEQQKLYDYLQLLGIGFGIKFLQLSSKLEVCSTGMRKLLEKTFSITNLCPGIEVWRTPPCAFACYPNEWERVLDIATLKCGKLDWNSN